MVENQKGETDYRGGEVEALRSFLFVRVARESLGGKVEERKAGKIDETSPQDLSDLSKISNDHKFRGKFFRITMTLTVLP